MASNPQCMIDSLLRIHGKIMVLEQLKCHLGEIKLDPVMILYIKIFQMSQMWNDRKWNYPITRNRMVLLMTLLKMQNPEAVNKKTDTSNLQKLSAKKIKR